LLCVQLEFGQFVSVPSALIKRSKQHFHTLSCGVDIILGLNGYVWLSANADADAKERANERKASGPGADANAAAAAAAGEAPAISATIRDNISRVRNVIVALAKSFVPIFTGTITDAYEQSERMQLSSKDILNPQNIQPVTEPALKRVQATGGGAAASAGGASAMAWDRT
jgi:exosome complex component RRP4